MERFASLKIPLLQIKLATNNFAISCNITSNMYERVYRAELDLFDCEKVLTKKKVVIKRMFPYKKVTQDFFVEIDMLTRCRHPNLVFLLGFCDEDSEMILVFECAFKETLNGYLRSKSNRTDLTWEKRISICLDIARGLNYLHNMNGKSSVIYQGILSANVFLDEKWTAKIADFRLSEFKPHPLSLGQLNQRLVIDDIFFLGVILFEILTGRLAYDPFYIEEDVRGFASMAREGKLENLVDPRIIKETQELGYTERKGPNQDSLEIFYMTASRCLAETQSERPTWEGVITSLEKALEFQVQNLDNSKMPNNFKYLKIPLEDIKSATQNFHNNCNIGSGEYGEVYKAELKMTSKDEPLEIPNSVVVKRVISRKDGHGNEGFLKEVFQLSKFKHPNIVSLHGFCVEGVEVLLVYEFASNRSLHDYLGNSNKMINLTWSQLLNICIGVARGLKYVHTSVEDKERIIHGNIKSSNILLGKNWEAKITDFLLSKLHPTSQVSTIDTNDIAHTNVYLDPEYAETGRLTKASDIYSFGIVLSEIFLGKLVIKENKKGLALQKKMLDPNIRGAISELQLAPDHDSLDAYLEIANLCIAKTQAKRPTIDVVIQELNKALYFQDQQNIKVQNLERLKIPLKDITSATDNFDPQRKIGSGAYGEVYQAQLKMKSKDKLHETLKTVAIKRIMNRTDSAGRDGFLVELDVLSKCEHPNVVSLLGFCVDGDEMLLVYEFVSNGSLDDFLGSNDKMTNFTWAQRLKMCIDIARGLNHLHTFMDNQKGIIHRDIKSGNILLDENWDAKIADFGFSKFNHVNTHTSTIQTETIAGTGLYLDPEYEKTGRLKKASDIYSFGVVLFEIFSGKLAYDEIYMSENYMGLAPIARERFEEATILEMLDPKLIYEASEPGFTRKVGPGYSSLNAFILIAYQCIAKTQESRPPIQAVLKGLKKALYFEENEMTTVGFSIEHAAYGRLEANLYRQYKRIFEFSDSPEIYSSMMKKHILDLLSKGTLLDHHRLEIIQALQPQTTQPKDVSTMVGANER